MPTNETVVSGDNISLTDNVVHGVLDIFDQNTISVDSVSSFMSRRLHTVFHKKARVLSGAFTFPTSLSGAATGAIQEYSLNASSNFNEVSHRQAEAKRLVKESQRLFKQEFKHRLDNDSLEFGMTSGTEFLVQQWLAKMPDQTKIWLNELYLENISDDKVLIALLKILAHSDETVLYPVSYTLAIAALSHRSIEVKECGVRAFEYWHSETALSAIENTTLTPAWLEEYKIQVVSDIRASLA